MSTPPPGPEALGRAGHSAVVHGQHMWVYGGYRLRDGRVATSGAPDMGNFLSQPGNPDDLVRFGIMLPLHVTKRRLNYISTLGTILLPRAGMFLSWRMEQAGRVQDMDILQ